MIEDNEEPAEDLEIPPDEEFEDDLPCIRCSYNLRGLKADGKCPECGASIQKSLDFATERILCLACMKPNHPSTAVCSGCGTPLHTAGATGAYFQTQARGVRRNTVADLDPDVEQELAKLEARKAPKYMLRPSPFGVYVVALLNVPMAMIFAMFGVSTIVNENDAVFAGSFFILLAILSLAIILLPWRKYARQRDAYIRYRGQKLKELEDKTDVEPAAQP